MTILSITWTVDPTIFTLFGKEIRWYGVCWALGILIGMYILQKMYKKEQLPAKWADSLFLYLIIGIIAGARLGHCLFYEPSYYLSHPIEIFKIWNGGLASHGGTIGVIIGVWLYSRRVTKKSIIWTLDRIIVPTGIIAAFIRIGNLMNHEIYGSETNCPLGFKFITNLTEWANGANPVYTNPSHPTQIYEAMAYLIVFAVTMHIYWRTNAKEKTGLLLGIGLVMIFVFRFFIEFIKNIQVPAEQSMRNDTGLILGQWLSIPFIIWGIYLILKANKKTK